MAHSHLCRVQKPKKYRTIRSECLKGGKLFLDDQFPLLDKSIFVLNEKSKQNAIKWIRAKDLCQNPLFFNDEFIKNGLENTKFGILFFLSALFRITTVYTVGFRAKFCDFSCFWLQLNSGVSLYQ